MIFQSTKSTGTFCQVGKHKIEKLVCSGTVIVHSHLITERVPDKATWSNMAIY